MLLGEEEAEGVSGLLRGVAVGSKENHLGQTQGRQAQYIIESNVTIVALLIFAHVLGWQTKPTPTIRTPQHLASGRNLEQR